jgi:hypothetical protein
LRLCKFIFCVYIITYLKYLRHERIIIQDELQGKHVGAKGNSLEVINNEKKRIGYCKIVWKQMSIKNHSMTFTLLQGHEGPEGEQRYTSTLSLTSALDGGGWPRPHPGRFNPWKEPQHPSNKRPRRSGQVRKISLLPGFDPRTFQHVANRYNGSAIPTHECVLN